jgi:ubiquinone/menaquinone biosynthesis C-methylase UbiE
LKELYKNTFNAVADRYGHSEMRFIFESAEQASSCLNLKGNEHVLDVATGTGCVALAIAKELPDGQVTGIDFSEGMLTRAIRNKNEQGIRNVTFTEMDMQALDYQDKQFDVAVSAFGIYFVEDMKKQLSHIAKKVKDGGTVLITTFSDNAFTPCVNLFGGRLEKYGIEVPSMAWQRVSNKDQCISLLKEVGLQKIKCEQKECGYYLRDASEWWYIIWNGGFRGLVNKLPQNDLKKFKNEHLAEVKDLQSDKGIWLEMSIIYTFGEKLAEQGTI